MNKEKILHDEAMDEDSEWAFWFDGKNINEVMFCQYFLRLHPKIDRCTTPAVLPCNHLSSCSQDLSFLCFFRCSCSFFSLPSVIIMSITSVRS